MIQGSAPSGWIAFRWKLNPEQRGYQLYPGRRLTEGATGYSPPADTAHAGKLHVGAIVVPVMLLRALAG
jgi:hypothetical protein